MVHLILKKFGIDANEIDIQPITTGLINKTWKIESGNEAWVLQRVNDSVFKEPMDIAENISRIGKYLSKETSSFLFVDAIETLDGQTLVNSESYGYFRLFPFVKNSQTINVVTTPDQAYEAAKQFGMFTHSLQGFDCSALKITIPNFHDLTLRYQQYLQTLKIGNPKRISEARNMIDRLNQHLFIVEKYEAIKSDPQFKVRATHHDTKISNILFDENEKGICVIDLDTVMPGYFISDVGDMMRTYLSPVDEEEADYSKIQVRPAFYHAIVNGYCSIMKDDLTDREKCHFFYAGLFMIYMQSIRFFTDYFNNDIYYTITYPEQNLVRATNQLVLLERMLEMEEILNG